MFDLPENLPATLAEVSALLDQADREINVIRARHAAGETLSAEDVDRLRYLLDSHDTLAAEQTRLAAEEQAHSDELNALLQRATPQTQAQAAPAEAPPGTETEPETQPDEQPRDPEPQPVEVIPADNPKGQIVQAGFDSLGQHQPPAPTRAPRWRMNPSCPHYQEGEVGFREIALALDSVAPGSRAVMQSNRPSKVLDGQSFSSQVIASLQREGLMQVETSHDLVAEIERATNERNLPGGSLTAAGGWCAPSEQLYDFCDVPDAVDLISLPEITVRRGGVRWPVEPDLSQIYKDFIWFFTEPELQADPPPEKHCVSIPCPDEFKELRLAVVGYCVEAGILQAQGWPELIEWFMRSLVQEHLRAISRRTILDMVKDSGAPIVIPPGTTIGAAASTLNSLALMATNIRISRSLARNATIEGVAPSWFHEVLRADLAMQWGTATKNITDAEINTWLSARNLALQFVGDWQTREEGQPGHLETVQWPETVQIMLYPAGTWFRAMSKVIEFGVMYPKEQLQVNRFTLFFTEDAYAVGHRCHTSALVEIPICVSGAFGAQQQVECNS